jgi:hypothetical protein
LPVSWPSNPKVALAYLDQLARSGDAMGNHAELRSALAAADALVSKGETDRTIRRQLRSLSRQISDDNGLKKDLKMQLEGIAETI